MDTMDKTLIIGASFVIRDVLLVLVRIILVVILVELLLIIR